MLRYKSFGRKRIDRLQSASVIVVRKGIVCTIYAANELWMQHIEVSLTSIGRSTSRLNDIMHNFVSFLHCWSLSGPERTMKSTHTPTVDHQTATFAGDSIYAAYIHP